MVLGLCCSGSAATIEATRCTRLMSSVAYASCCGGPRRKRGLFRHITNILMWVLYISVNVFFVVLLRLSQATNSCRKAAEFGAEPEIRLTCDLELDAQSVSVAGHRRKMALEDEPIEISFIFIALSMSPTAYRRL